MEKHFVTFCSPGSFVSEKSTEEIDSWDVNIAVEKSRTVKERHGATPYGFYFTTRSRGDEDLDSRVTAKSNMYYLGGEILTLEEIKKQNNPEDRTLISNMEGNGWDKVVVNKNSYKWTAPLEKDDVVLRENHAINCYN